MVLDITDLTASLLREKKEPCYKHESDNDLVVLNSCSTFMCVKYEKFMK